MSWLAIAFATWSALTGLVSVIMALARTSPDDAVSNLSKWAKRAGLHDIPQWLRNQRADEIANKAQPIPLGVSTNMDEDGNFEYIAAVEVSKVADLPKGLSQFRIPAQHYAVFRHSGHVSTLGETYSAIWNEWLPVNDRKQPMVRAWNAILRRSTPALVSAASISGFHCKTPDQQAR